MQRVSGTDMLTQPRSIITAAHKAAVLFLSMNSFLM